MTYFKIGENDYSTYISELKVNSSVNYNSQTNAAGNTVVDYINTKRAIEVGVIALDDSVMQALQNDLAQFNVSISFRNPATNELEAGVNCIIPSNNVEYYTIRTDKVMYKAFNLQFIEL